MDFPSFLSFSPSSEDPEWASLPEPVLYLILSHLFLLSDIVSFGRVCSRWYSVSKFRLEELRFTSSMSFKKHLPMLLIPTVDSSVSTRNLFSLTDAKVYDLKLPVPYNKRCIGSSHGWLIFLDGLSYVITLFNPFYFGSGKGTIHLPRFVAAGYLGVMAKDKSKFLADYFICKAILSSDPSSHPNDFIVTIIYGNMRSLAFYKSRDASWTCLNRLLCEIYDVMYHEESLLALNFWGEVYECDMKSNLLKLQLATDPVAGSVGELTRRYIVATDEGNCFLQAVRLVESIVLPGTGESSVLSTYGFLVYEFETLSDSFEWVPRNHIYGGALLVGDNHSTYLSPSKCSGLIRNAIYFTDDYHDTDTVNTKPYQSMGHRDCGIYLMEEERFATHYISCPWQKDMPPPIWMLPTY